jgi:hypothetical protein
VKIDNIISLGIVFKEKNTSMKWRFQVENFGVRCISNKQKYPFVAQDAVHYHN